MRENPLSNKFSVIRSLSMSAVDWPILAPRYQPASSALTTEVVIAAHAIRPNIPDALINFIGYSSTIFYDANGVGNARHLPTSGMGRLGIRYIDDGIDHGH